MDIHTSGIARIRSRETGEIFTIEADELDWDDVGSDERQMGPETTYMAVIDHPELGQISWTLWEYPMGAENDRETDVNGHELLENVRFSLEHLPDYDGPIAAPPSLDERLAALPAQIDALERAIAALRSELPMLGHNQAPPEYRLGLHELDLDRVSRDTTILRTELAKAEPAAADPHQLQVAQSGLRRLAAKLWGLIRGAGMAFAGALGGAIVSDLWQDPVALHAKVITILDTVGAWLQSLIG